MHKLRKSKQIIYPYPFISIPLSLFLYPYFPIPIPLSLFLYPYPIIPVPLFLLLYPFPLSQYLYLYPFIPISLMTFYSYTYIGIYCTHIVQICKFLENFINWLIPIGSNIVLIMYKYCQAQPQLNSTQPQLNLRLRWSLFPKQQLDSPS